MHRGDEMNFETFRFTVIIGATLVLFAIVGCNMYQIHKDTEIQRLAIEKNFCKDTKTSEYIPCGQLNNGIK